MVDNPIWVLRTADAHPLLLLPVFINWTQLNLPPRPSLVYRLMLFIDWLLRFPRCRFSQLDPLWTSCETANQTNQSYCMHWIVTTTFLILMSPWGRERPQQIPWVKNKTSIGYYRSVAITVWPTTLYSDTSLWQTDSSRAFEQHPVATDFGKLLCMRCRMFGTTLLLKSSRPYHIKPLNVDSLRHSVQHTARS